MVVDVMAVQCTVQLVSGSLGRRSFLCYRLSRTIQLHGLPGCAGDKGQMQGNWAGVAVCMSNSRRLHNKGSQSGGDNDQAD